MDFFDFSIAYFFILPGFLTWIVMYSHGSSMHGRQTARCLHEVDSGSCLYGLFSVFISVNDSNLYRYTRRKPFTSENGQIAFTKSSRRLVKKIFSTEEYRFDLPSNSYDTFRKVYTEASYKI